ncbi:DNA cytosine methyltransferase [Pectobacterium zantedeschiae]|uniref:DNA cytosine methyltransferase n=1 Tax=Pectobacterium zantedeschiae TaxID=2034769 RepID=UPI00101D0AAE|nr:DNA cytosine methyltransferase [Pectobacterium zantedeschiae]RYC43094.1 DNA (cytosine-5-)-methyltransferase [Pectobacterium zantedeschiae]
MNFIDVFSGCGGLSLGLLNAGLNGLFAIEKNPDAFSTLKKNLVDNHKYINKSFNWLSGEITPESHDIHDLINDKSTLSFLSQLGRNGSVDLIVGGPPCQGFSLAGRRDPNDPRNQLANAYLKVVEEIRPKFILMENVKGINLKFDKNKNDISMSDKIKATLRKMGYVAISFIENSAAWGVPQSRNRFILLGIRMDLFTINIGFDVLERELLEKISFEIKKFSAEFTKNKGLRVPVSSEDAISDLKVFINSNSESILEISHDAPGIRFKQLKYSSENKKLSDYQKLMRAEVNDLNFIAGGLRLANHSDLIKKRFAKILVDLSSERMTGLYKIAPGKNLSKNYIDEQLEVRKHTICVLNKNKPSPTITTLPDDLLHYDEPRILTVRECARIQSFPDWYEFLGPYTTGGERRKKSCPKYTQVGNAVPPLMAEGLGSFISNHLLDIIKKISIP